MKGERPVTTKYSHTELSPSTYNKGKSNSDSHTDYVKLINRLTSLAGCANVSINETLEDLFEMTKKKILENHKYKIYFSEKLAKHSNIRFRKKTGASLFALLI